MPELSRRRARVVFACPFFFASALAPDASLAQKFLSPETAQPSDPIVAERRALLREGPLDREGTKWLSSSFRGSFYDSELEMFLPRAGLALSGGYRPGTYGYFGTIQYDSFWDLGQNVTHLGSLSVGGGGEWLYFHGRARSAVAVGLSVLANRTVLLEAGHRGVFLDVIPLAVRLPVADGVILDLAPLNYSMQIYRVTYPEFNLSQFVSTLSMEWTL